MWFFYIMAALIGLVIGSFLNACIYRFPRQIKISKGHSICPRCNHQLSWLDLFPLFSYLFLGGRCRYCKVKISPRYPLIEALTALIYVVLTVKFGLGLATLGYFIMTAALIIAAFVDLEFMEIPDQATIALLAAGLILLATPGDAWLSKVIGLFVVSVPLLLIAMIGNAMGGGDVKLMAGVGFCIGWQMVIVAFFIGVVAGGIFAIIKMLYNKADFKTMMPFGPFLVVGTVAVIFWGQNMLGWYLTLLR